MARVKEKLGDIMEIKGEKYELAWISPSRAVKVWHPINPVKAKSEVKVEKSNVDK